MQQNIYRKDKSPCIYVLAEILEKFRIFTFVDREVENNSVQTDRSPAKFWVMRSFIKTHLRLGNIACSVIGEYGNQF